MSDLVMSCVEAVSDARGVFRPRVMARERADASWEAWLEFVPAAGDAGSRYATPPETHQRDRAAVERWASGVTRVYTEGALARAVHAPSASPVADAELRAALEEIVAALDRRIPNVLRAGESGIAAEAARLRACALRRMALLGPSPSTNGS